MKINWVWYFGAFFLLATLVCIFLGMSVFALQIIY